MEPSDWIVVGVVAAVMVLGIGIQLGVTFLPDVDKDFYMQDTMARAMGEMLEQAPKPPQDEFWRLLIVPLRNDSKGRIARELRSALRGFDEGSDYRVADPDYVADEIEKDFKSALVVGSEAEALKVGQHFGTDVVVWGEVTGYGDSEDATEVSFNLVFERMPMGKIEPLPKVLGTVQVKRRLSKSFLSLDYYRLRLAETSTLYRVILWFVIAAGLPFALYPVCMKVIDADSNASNFTLLAGLILLAMIASLLLNGFAFSGTWMILYLGIIIGCGAYYLALLNAFQEGD